MGIKATEKLQELEHMNICQIYVIYENKTDLLQNQGFAT